MVRLEVLRQDSGITNTMTTEIINTIRTAIEINGTIDIFTTCQVVKEWLEHTYGGTWGVIIGKLGDIESCCDYYDEMYLWIIDNDTNWTFKAFKQARDRIVQNFTS